MAKFLLKRILIMIPVLLGVLVIVFFLSHFMPGDPVENFLPEQYTQEQYDAKAAELGLDKPLVVQLVDYVVGVVTRLDLGTSYNTGRPVTQELADRVFVTIRLGLMSCALCLIIAIPLGVLSAIKQNSFLDYALTTISIFFASMPSFWLALMALMIFCVHLAILPASGLYSWKHYILPVLCMGLMPIASTTRMTRSSMLEVIRQDYIRTARAKGIAEGQVIKKHALRNALIPIITVAGTQFSLAIGGTVVIESIFTIRGMGSLMVSAINSRDYPVVMGITLVISVFISVINLFVDIAYSIADPRIKAQFSSSKAKRKPRKQAVQGGESEVSDR